MNGSGWDTRGSGTTRTGGGYRLAIVLAAALLTVAILAAVTGKVLASNPPILPDSSPTADHIERPAPDLSPELPDPRSLFLDLPEPPKPQAPEASDVNLDDRNPGNRNSDGRNSEDRDSADRGSASGVPGGAVSSKRSSGGVGNARGLEGGATDLPIGTAVPERVPPVQPVKPGSGKVEDLLDDPDCQFSIFALTDLRNGIVDEYLISALQAVCREHSIYVNVFKTGHTFGAGLEEGPTIPIGYGEAGGFPNTHYFGRAADIWEVDGKPVEGNGADPDVVSVGRILAGLSSKNGPDVVIGPDSWNRALGYGPDQGWVLAPDQVALHDDHLHIGYWHGDGTPPPQVYLSPEQRRESSLPAHGAGLQTPALRRSDNDVDRSSDKTSPKLKPRLKETREPAESPAPKSRPARDVEEPKNREKPETQRSIVRRTQRSGSQDTAPQEADSEKTDPKKPGSDKTDPEATRESPREPRDRKPEPNTRPPMDKEDQQEPGEVSPGEDQYTDVEEALVQNEIVMQETTSGGETVTEDAGPVD